MIGGFGNMPDENKKIKMLIFADSPSVATGFGKVTKGIFKNLAETGKYEITIFGINDRGGWKDPVEHPYKVYPTAGAGSQDIYGFNRLISILRGKDWEIKIPWDIVFTLNDPFIFEMPLMGYDQGLMHIIKDVLYKLYRETTAPEFWWKLVSYWPVDSQLKGNWVADAVALPDYSVAYTKYGVQEIEKANKSLVKPSEIKNLSYIYHGTDVEDFFGVTPEEKKEFKMKFFKKNNINPDTFIVTCVARNQMRKDIPRVMKIFREFQKRRPDSFLYIHAKNEDAHGSLLEFARSFGLEQGRDWTIPSNFNESIGFPVSALNLIYNASDVVISTSHGEGWGLPITEAMATKTISLAPNHTSIREIFGTEDSDYEDLGNLEKSTTIRGIPIKCGSTTSEWVTYGRDDYERIRPIANVDDAVKKLIWIYDNPDKIKVIAERAYNWIQQYSWKNIAQQWDELFTKVYQELEEERKTYDPEKQKQKIKETLKIEEEQKKE